MTTWITGFVLLVVLAGLALWRESVRVTAVETWVGAHGFTRVFPVPPEGVQPARRLVAALAAHGARRWGMVLEGRLGAASVSVAEHESSVTGRQSGVWHTIALWPSAATGGRLAIDRGTGSATIGAAAQALGNVVREPLIEALGVPIDPPLPFVRTQGGWVVSGEPSERDRWLTPDRMRLLDQWPHGGSFVREDGYAAWRVEGRLTPGYLDRLATEFETLRRLLD